MQSSIVINTVSCHAEGEVGDVITGGVYNPPGNTILEKSQYISKNKKLKNFILNEPRGGVFRHVNLLVPPINKKADYGWIIMEPEDTPPMSGSNAICVSTVLIETGMVKITEPETKILLESPSGLIEATIACKDQKATNVKIRNVPSFVDKLDYNLETEDYGTIKIDTAFGGDTFIITDAKKLGFTLCKSEARDLALAGSKIIRDANKQLKFKHPNFKEINNFSFCQFSGNITKKNNILSCKNAVVIKPGKIDRSPCGTGCSAKIATLVKRGLMKKTDYFIGKSIINSTFKCKILNSITKKDKEFIIPEISGRAWITGFHQHLLDPKDPWPGGYKISDTWPNLIN